MNSLWILIACSVACAYAQPTCDNTRLDKCNDMLPSMSGGDLFPSDPNTLQVICSKAVPGYECYSEVVKECPLLLPGFFNEYYYAAKDLSLQVCKAGHFQTIYLKHAECLNEIMNTKQSICEERADQDVAQGKYYYKSLEDCLDAFVGDICGGEAEEVLGEFLKVIKLIF